MMRKMSAMNKVWEQELSDSLMRKIEEGTEIPKFNPTTKGKEVKGSDVVDYMPMYYKK